MVGAGPHPVGSARDQAKHRRHGQRRWRWGILQAGRFPGHGTALVVVAVEWQRHQCRLVKLIQLLKPTAVAIILVAVVVAEEDRGSDAGTGGSGRCGTVVFIAPIAH